MNKAMKFFLILLCSFSPVTYGQRWEPEHIENKKNLTEEQLKINCNNNDSTSCLILGYNILDRLVKTNDTTEEEDEKMLQYYKKSCDLNNPIACSEYGALFEAFPDSLLIKHPAHLPDMKKGQDRVKAFEYKLKSCNLKYGRACMHVAIFYGQGYGVNQDFQKMNQYYNEACNLGYTKACNKLASTSKGQSANTALDNYIKACSLTKDSSEAAYGCDYASYMYLQDLNKMITQGKFDEELLDNSIYYKKRECKLRDQSGDTPYISCILEGKRVIVEVIRDSLFRFRQQSRNPHHELADIVNSVAIEAKSIKDQDIEKYIDRKFEDIKEKDGSSNNIKQTNNQQSDEITHNKAVPHEQAVISKHNKKGDEHASNLLKYQGYIASESDTEDLKKFLDNNIGKVVELDLYYPESVSLHQYDITGDTPVVRQLNLSSISNSSVVDNVFSSWGNHHFIHSTGTIQVTNQQFSDYERKKGHLSFWMYENSNQNSMFIINISSESDQFIWQTSNDIDDNIRNFNFNALNNGGEFRLMELYGSFKVESPVNSADFTSHEGYPTYPELWQEEDQDYIHFDPDGEPTDTLVYNLIPQ